MFVRRYDPSVKPRTVILLGASNLTIGWRPLLVALRSFIADPVKLHIATGMGRSYCDWSSFWFRRLPAIVECGLWNRLADGSPAHPSDEAPLVLVTDIGNDIVYGLPPATIATHVEQCISRILAWRNDARIVMTGLPMASVLAITKPQFLVSRTLLFPFCFLSLNTIQRRSADLDAAVRAIAERFAIPVVTPLKDWFGHDPIHVLRELREDVFRQYFSHWELERLTSPPPDRSTLPPLPPAALRQRFRIPVRQPQPAFTSREWCVHSW